MLTGSLPELLEHKLIALDTSKAVSLDSSTDTHIHTTMQNRFVHNVFFWLKNPASTEDAKALVTGIRTLFDVPTVQDAHLGKPAPTDRSVIDNTYSYHLMLTFASLEDQNTYQLHPIHLTFVDDCAHLWDKVLVYDSDSSLLDN